MAAPTEQSSERRLNLPNPAATEALGAALAPGCRPGARIFLQGELGGGKTTLVRGLLHALGHAGPVRSPSYTLVETYELPRFPAHHLDLYRLSAAELEGLGIREYFRGDALSLVEWPERAGPRLGPADLRIFLEAAGAERRALLRGETKTGILWLREIKLLSNKNNGI